MIEIGTVLIVARNPEVYAGPLRTRYPELTLAGCPSYESFETALRERRPSIVLASEVEGGLPFPRQALFSCPTLEWVQTASAGIDHLLPLVPRVRVTSASGIHDEVLADYVIGAVLMSNLGLARFLRQQRERVWQPHELVPSTGQTLAVLGLGSVGALVCRKARAIGMRVVGVKARPEIRPVGVDEVFGVDRLLEVVAAADFLAVCLPLTPRTRGLVSADLLLSMKRGSVLINISRGGIVDEEALVVALREGPLAGAVSDVFATEPLPPESELWGLDNLVITPHTGDVRGWQSKVVELFCDNLERWQAGQPLRNLVDPERGY